MASAAAQTYLTPGEYLASEKNYLSELQKFYIILGKDISVRDPDL